MNSFEIVDILLVEDNPRDAELTMRALKKRNMANQLYWVEDGAEALDFMFGREKYSQRDHLQLPKVILLDLKLPKVDGFQVLKAIKNDERTASTPVVIMTSSREDPDIKNAYKLGANSYIVKPVDFNNFTEVMSQIGFYWLFVNQNLS
jgi:two-component system, response regulator